MLIVTDDYEAAWKYKMDRERDPEDQYIYRIVSDVIEFRGLSVPPVVRVIEIGEWQKVHSKNLVNMVKRIKGMIQAQQQLEREKRREAGRIARERLQQRQGQGRGGG